MPELLRLARRAERLAPLKAERREQRWASAGAAVGVLLGCLCWAAGGWNVQELVAWLFTGGVAGLLTGAALARIDITLLPSDIRRGIGNQWPRESSRAAELRCTVRYAVALRRVWGGELLVLDVGDGKLLLLPSVIGTVHLEYLGFPHERFELTVGTRPNGPADVLNYQGQGETVFPYLTIPATEVEWQLRGIDVPEDGFVFDGKTDTCLDDLRAALSGASDDQIPSRSA